jgi:ubiquinone/menaquinone biosynthesis C-methylase UbiE
MEKRIKPYRGMGMEGMIARWYSSQTKRAMSDFELLAQRVAERLPERARVLEVAPGPGYFAVELARLDDFQVTGLDISRTFVEIARENARAAGVRVDFQRGSASDMPFAADSFDFLLCRAAFKNFTEPVRVLNEMYRVLKPGGKAWIIDLRRDASPQQIGQAVNAMHLGNVNGIITKLTFRFMLLKRAYSKPEFEGLLTQTPFQNGKIREDAIGFEAELIKTNAARHKLAAS